MYIVPTPSSRRKDREQPSLCHGQAGAMHTSPSWGMLWRNSNFGSFASDPCCGAKPLGMQPRSTGLGLHPTQHEHHTSDSALLTQKKRTEYQSRRCGSTNPTFAMKGCYEEGHSIIWKCCNGDVYVCHNKERKLTTPFFGTLCVPKGASDGTVMSATRRWFDSRPLV